jgi:hypothetical protein
VKSFTSHLGQLSTRYLQLGNLPIIKNVEGRTPVEGGTSRK